MTTGNKRTTWKKNIRKEGRGRENGEGRRRQTVERSQQCQREKEFYQFGKPYIIVAAMQLIRDSLLA